MYLRGQAILENPQSTPAQKAMARQGMHNLMVVSQKLTQKKGEAHESMRPRMKLTYLRAQETIDNPNSTPAQKALARRAQKRLMILSQKPRMKTEPMPDPRDKCFIEIKDFSLKLAHSLADENTPLSWHLDRRKLAKRAVLILATLEDRKIRNWFFEKTPQADSELQIRKDWYASWSQTCPDGHPINDEKEALIALTAAHLQAAGEFGTFRSRQLLDQLFGFDIAEQLEWSKRAFRESSSEEHNSRHWGLIQFASVVGTGVGIVGTISFAGSNVTNMIGGFSVLGLVCSFMLKYQHRSSVAYQQSISKAWAPANTDEDYFEKVYL